MTKTPTPASHAESTEAHIKSIADGAIEPLRVRMSATLQATGHQNGGFGILGTPPDAEFLAVDGESWRVAILHGGDVSIHGSVTSQRAAEKLVFKILGWVSTIGSRRTGASFLHLQSPDRSATVNCDGTLDIKGEWTPLAREFLSAVNRAFISYGNSGVRSFAEADGAEIEKVRKRIQDLEGELALGAAPASPAQQGLAVTDEMALAFHRAVSDGAIGQDDVNDIKEGLRAALCNLHAPAQAQQDALAAVAVPDEREAFEKSFGADDDAQLGRMCLLSNSEYSNSETQAAWAGWQARAALAAAPAPAAVAVPTFEGWAKAVGGDFARHNCGPYEADAMKLAGMAWRAALAAGSAAPASQDAQDAALTQAARDVLAERQRQISAEGWTPEHDDVHGNSQLAIAAACYAGNAAGKWGIASAAWPWDGSWWKPSTPRRDLEKAGALILAEIERLDRAALAAQQAGEKA